MGAGTGGGGIAFAIIFGANAPNPAFPGEGNPADFALAPFMFKTCLLTTTPSLGGA